ncbi:50S ribosomal protein L4 [Candidatus Nomurabacteria bacterium]|nr:50S ribosomal protein L4 [Candidatus Nomurabacteria bacterium]
MKIDVYTHKGTKSKSAVELSDLVFASPWNESLVHQAIVAMQSNARQGTAHTKDRSEVRGGGKKPWRQKGTGRARHGSRRSPIWVGGGITFGPRADKIWDKKINRKMKIKALYTALSQKMRDEQVLGLEDLSGINKTKDVEAIMTALASGSGFETLNTRTNTSNICVVLPEHDADVVKALRNLPHVKVTNALECNTLDVANNRYLVLVDPVRVDEILASRHHTNETVVSSATATAKESA